MAITLKPLADQVILITGASSGIGLVTARAAARKGASVMLVARGEAALREIAAGLTAEGHEAAFFVADVESIHNVRRAGEAAIERFGRINTWVNCAGVALYAKLVDTPEDEHRKLFDTNYFGVVHGSLIAIQHLRQHGGALITVGSIAGDMPSPVMGAYAASKHAVKGYTESLRIEVNADRLPISVTLIKPSGIDTPIAAHAANHVDGEALIPPPAYAPELVADAILDAAVRQRREITVGGVGKLQVLLATHFPGLLAKFGGAMMPGLSDSDQPQTQADNLDAPFRDGEENSDRQFGSPISVYATLSKPGAKFTLISAVGLGAFVLALRRQSGARKNTA